jgi:predicted regulator of Ras-like GTPase activity (Roadblock/LC7/MglB family)
MALVGNLKDLKLPNLVQLNCLERNTVKLTIEHAGRYGFVYFQNGQIAHAEYDPDVGENAFFRLLLLSEGQFKVESGVRPPMISIKSHWNNLLLEGLHHVDSVELSNKSQEQQNIAMLMNVKGVQNAAVITPDGKVLASIKDIDDEGVLHALSYLEVQKLNNIVSMVEPKYVSMQEQNVRILLMKFNENIIYLELETKIQIEMIIEFIKKALS